VRVAAWQAPLAATGSLSILELIREQIDKCEDMGVDVLCCPEAVLGGLADYAGDPFRFAFEVESGELEAVLASIASDTVTTIVGFTERCGALLYNSAAVYERRSIAGVYRKMHPALRRSIYQPGNTTPVFTVGGLTFGIIICNDSNFDAPARAMAAAGATTIFVPTNNGLPHDRKGETLVDLARQVDIARARDLGVSIVRADVAGETSDLISYGSSGVTGADGRVLATPRRLEPGLAVAEV
jgi:predicted amidohydrolase